MPHGNNPAVRCHVTRHFARPRNLVQRWQHAEAIDTQGAEPTADAGTRYTAAGTSGPRVRVVPRHPWDSPQARVLLRERKSRAGLSRASRRGLAGLTNVPHKRRWHPTRCDEYARPAASPRPVVLTGGNFTSFAAEKWSRAYLQRHWDRGADVDCYVRPSPSPPPALRSYLACMQRPDRMHLLKRQLHSCNCNRCHCHHCDWVYVCG